MYGLATVIQLTTNRTGQILTYSGFFPEHTKRIHLFGDCTPQKKEVICSTVFSFGVIATFEGLEVNHDS